MKSKNLIFEALAFIDNYKSSPSMQGMEQSGKAVEVYIKNTIISLISIKHHNPNTDVALVTNIVLDEKWNKMLIDKGIYVWQCDYENYRMPAEIVYSLSYYKLCAFDYILKNTDYDKMCFVDCDTFGVGSFDMIWEEVESAFLMIPNDYAINAKIRCEITDLHARIMAKKNRIVPHISSGFIAGKRTDVKVVMERCQHVYNAIITMHDVAPVGGDEVIWSIALADYEGKMYCPRAYVLLANIGVKDYWVDKADYEDENIVLWHLPTEKRYALIWAYNKYVQTGMFPSIKEMAKACRIRKIKNRFNILAVKVIMGDKTVLKRNISKIFKR